MATAGSTLWQNCLALYNNASYSSLIPTDPTSGKQVFFVPHNPTLPPDASIVAAIQSNGGRNNVVVVSMWADFPATDYGTGLWGFFSPCTCVLPSARLLRVGACVCACLPDLLCGFVFGYVAVWPCVCVSAVRDFVVAACHFSQRGYLR